MNYGRYFTFDVNASQLTKGLTVFNYRGVKNGKVAKDSNAREKYPIYVNFSKDGVFFHQHYCDCNTSSSSRAHSNSLILALPISTSLDIADNLSINIVSIFKSKYPSNDEDSIMYDYAAESLRNSEEHSKGITYSSLEVFGINYNEPTDVNRPPIIGLLRKIFLDFLYDLEHTNIFKNAPYYDAVYVALNENFLFRSLRNKAEYYFQRKSSSSGNDSVKSSFFSHSDRDIFMADYYVDAERRWVDTIADPRSDKVFHIASGWFLAPEDEMNEVYQSGHLKYQLPDKNEKIISKNTTLRCADFLAKIRYPRSDDRDKVKYNDKCTEKYDTQVRETANIALDWYLHKYCFAGVMKIWHGTGHNIWRMLTALISTLLLVSLFYRPMGLSVGEDYILAPAIILLALLLLRIFTWLKDRKRMGQVGGINVFMPRLLASILTAWFTLAIGEDIFKGFFDTEHSWAISGSLFVVIYLFVQYEIGKLNPFLSCKKRIVRSITLISIAFVYSFLAGVFIIDFFGGKYLERSDYIDEFYINNIYIEEPKYEVRNCAEYSHNYFYGVIKKYNANLLSQISSIDNIASVNIAVDGALNNPIDIEHKSYSIKTPHIMTLKLISIFSQGHEHTKEIHQKTTEGSLVSIRIDNLEKYVDSIVSCKQRHIEFTKKEEADLNIKGKLGDENYRDDSWIMLLKAINNHEAYRETLKELRPTEESGIGGEIARLSPVLDLLIFRKMLLQFTFVAMFIGIFLQLIFEEKPITEPI